MPTNFGVHGGMTRSDRGTSCYTSCYTGGYTGCGSRTNACFTCCARCGIGRTAAAPLYTRVPVSPRSDAPAALDNA